MKLQRSNNKEQETAVRENLTAEAEEVNPVIAHRSLTAPAHTTQSTAPRSAATT